MNSVPILIFICLISLCSSVSIYEQCGGVGYTGSTQCNWPLKCFHRSQSYAQCRVDCPADWLCRASTSESTKKYLPPTVNLTEFATLERITVQKRSSTDDNDDKDSMFGRILVGQMLGSDSVGLDANSYQPSNSSDIFQIIVEYIYEILKLEDASFIRYCETILDSEDLKEKIEALGDASKRLERIVTGSRLKEALMEDPRFLELHEKALANLGNSAGAMQINKSPCNGPVPEIGQVNGFYGNPAKLNLMEEATAAYRDVKTNAKVNGIQLAMLDYGFGGKPNLESRLGAYYTTRGYKSGSVGSAIHRIIGGMYLFLGSAGEEKLGRIYSDPVVKTLLNQPIESDAIRCLAYIEDLYYSNVRKENPQSVGGTLGSVVTPRTRDCLTLLINGVFCA